MCDPPPPTHTQELVWKMDQYSFPVGKVGKASLIEKVIFSEYQVMDQVQKPNNPEPIYPNLVCLWNTLPIQIFLCAHEPTKRDHTKD